MYLFRLNKGNYVSVYNFYPDRRELMEYKKRFLSDIKSVKLHINNPKTVELLYKSPTIKFAALDRKEKNQRVTFIEETKNDRIVSKYINGNFDSIDPVSVVGSGEIHKSLHSGQLFDEDCTLRFKGGCNSGDEHVTDEGVLLTGWLDAVQPLFSNSIHNLIFPDFLYEYDVEEIDELLQLFSCTMTSKSVPLDTLDFLQENGLISFAEDFYDYLNKSESVLYCYNEARKRVKNK